jgi:glycine/D-amino acid oxidase-like deaminating enzyme/nitrite reductase/ring-hydroxylating ferredoxin subunit
MVPSATTSESLWLATTPSTAFPRLPPGLHADVAVLGGGIVGITTAWLLKQAGYRVTVLEARRIIAGATGNTTAKVTALHDLIYRYLIERAGEQRARLYAHANMSAIEEIARVTTLLGIDCDFTWANAYTFAETDDQVRAVEREVEAAVRIGLPAKLVYSCDLPFPIKAAIELPHQAHFHPRRYLLALATMIPGEGSHVFEQTTAIDVRDGQPCVIETNRGPLTADRVVVATHQPFLREGFWFARMYVRRSYVLGVRLAGTVPAGMYISAHDDDELDFHSYRPARDDLGPLLLVGGAGHRTGMEGNTAARLRALEAHARGCFDVVRVDYRWGVQDNVTFDRIPYVGRLSRRMRNVFFATGFRGWGMTNGTASAMLLSDLIQGRKNAWNELYSSRRADLLPNARKLMAGGMQTAARLLGGHLRIPASHDAADIAPGSARIIQRGWMKVGVYRDLGGNLHAVSPICTHLRCVLRWNNAETSWDCPCDGSRFDADGHVLQGPAVKDLRTVDLRTVVPHELTEGSEG